VGFDVDEGGAAELDLGLEEDFDSSVLRAICDDDESDDKVMEVALPSFEFMVNKLIGSAPGQQLLLY
jgi:hypothetical protein